MPVTGSNIRHATQDISFVKTVAWNWTTVFTSINNYICDDLVWKWTTAFTSVNSFFIKSTIQFTWARRTSRMAFHESRAVHLLGSWKGSFKIRQTSLIAFQWHVHFRPLGARACFRVYFRLRFRALINSRTCSKLFLNQVESIYQLG